MALSDIASIIKSKQSAAVRDPATRPNLSAAYCFIAAANSCEASESGCFAVFLTALRAFANADLRRLAAVFSGVLCVNSFARALRMTIPNGAPHNSAYPGETRAATGEKYSSCKASRPSKWAEMPILTSSTDLPKTVKSFPSISDSVTMRVGATLSLTGLVLTVAYLPFDASK